MKTQKVTKFTQRKYSLEILRDSTESTKKSYIFCHVGTEQSKLSRFQEMCPLLQESHILIPKYNKQQS